MKYHYFNQKENAVVMVIHTDEIRVYYYQIIKYVSGNIVHKYTVEGFEFIDDVKKLYCHETGYKPSNEVQFRYVAEDYYSTIKSQGDAIRKHWQTNN